MVQRAAGLRDPDHATHPLSIPMLVQATLKEAAVAARAHATHVDGDVDAALALLGNSSNEESFNEESSDEESPNEESLEASTAEKATLESDSTVTTIEDVRAARLKRFSQPSSPVASKHQRRE